LVKYKDGLCVQGQVVNIFLESTTAVVVILNVAGLPVHSRVVLDLFNHEEFLPGSHEMVPSEVESFVRQTDILDYFCCPVNVEAIAHTSIGSVGQVSISNHENLGELRRGLDLGLDHKLVICEVEDIVDSA